jgi:phosphotransferase system HPr (HPr) family protein
VSSEIVVTVRNEHGLHARPAATFVQTAATFRSAVQVSNLTAGRGPAPAKSILSLLTLGVRPGDEVRLRAEGDDADAALSALVALLEAESTDGGRQG